MAKIPVLLTCDLEPELRHTRIHEADAWGGLAEIFATLSQLRPRLTRATGSPVHFNWFLRLDPQIEESFGTATWLTDHHADRFKEFAAAGDELGIHAHAYRRDDAADAWIVDHGNQPWVDHSVESSVAAYRRVFGRGPRAFRFGDHFMNNDTMATIARCGFAYDLTLEPGCHAARSMTKEDVATGMLPDCHFVPRAMYRPSRLDYQRPGLWLRRKLWIIPVSTGCSHGPVIPDPSDPQPMLYPLHLMMDPAIFRRIVDGLLEQMNRPYLVMVSRSGDAASAQALANFGANTEFISTHPRVSDFAFCTPGEAVTLYAV